MGECFEIMNILVEVLRYKAQSRGPWGIHISISKSLQSPFSSLVWHIKKQCLLVVIFLPEMLSDSRLILTTCM